MQLDKLVTGLDVPNDIYVVIEIPANGPGLKLELDKNSGALLVDRFMATPMHYPCNYGFVPHTLSLDGDPLEGYWNWLKTKLVVKGGKVVVDKL